MRRTKEIIEERKLKQGKDGRRRQQNRGEDSRGETAEEKGREKTRKIWRKEEEVSAKKKAKTHRFCFLFFYFFL